MKLGVDKGIGVVRAQHSPALTKYYSKQTNYMGIPIYAYRAH